MVIALDGPAGVGKSSVSKRIAELTGIHYLNSGNFYRVVAYAAIEKGIDRSDAGAVERFAVTIDLSYDRGRVLLGGEEVNDRLHSDEVDAEVAQVSSFRGVREYVNSWLRRIAGNTDIIVEGRDITTVVFPDADVKVFLDASPEIRARRRYDQGVSELSVEEIAEGIRKRDEIDRSKAWGSLSCPADAIYVDTSGLTIEQVCDKVVRKIHEIQ